MLKNTFLRNTFQEQSPRRVQLKKVFLKASKNSKKNTRHEGLQNYRKETPAPSFFGEFCKIFSNTCFVEHLLTTTSYFWTAFPIQARINNNYVARITQNVSMFGFPKYGDTSAPHCTKNEVFHYGFLQ